MALTASDHIEMRRLALKAWIDKCGEGLSPPAWRGCSARESCGGKQTAEKERVTIDVPSARSDGRNVSPRAGASGVAVAVG